MSGVVRPYLMTLIAALPMLLCGYDQGATSIIVVTGDFIKTLNLDQKLVLQSTTVAIYVAGSFLGAIIPWPTEKMIGLKAAILLGTTVTAVGILLQALSYSVGQTMIGRMLAGVGNGINGTMGPIWVTEMCGSVWLEWYASAATVMNAIGFTCASWITSACSLADGSVAWRLPLATQILLVLIVYASLVFELATRDGTDRHCMESGTTTSEYAKTGSTGAGGPTLSATLFRRRYRSGKEGHLRELLLGFGAQILRQLGGVGLVSYYIPLILIDSAGFSHATARLIAAFSSLLYLLFGFVRVINTDRLSRKKKMIVSALGQSASYFALAKFLQLAEEPAYPSTKVYASISAFFICLYCVFHVTAWQETSWVYLAKVKPNPTRARGMAMHTATNWALSFIVVELAPIGIAALRWKFYIFWAMFNLAVIPSVYFFLPETANSRAEGGEG